MTIRREMEFWEILSPSCGCEWRRGPPRLWGPSRRPKPTNYLIHGVWRWWDSRGYQEDVPSWNEEGFDQLEVITLDEAPPGSGVPGVKMEHRESPLMASLGEFTGTLEDVARLKMLSLFREASSMGIVLKRSDEKKVDVLGRQHGFFEYIWQVDLCNLIMNL